jgi:hypothetical protein
MNKYNTPPVVDYLNILDQITDSFFLGEINRGDYNLQRIQVLVLFRDACERMKEAQ